MILNSGASIRIQLVEHIANGKATDAIDASLHQEEARKKTLLAELTSASLLNGNFL